MSRRKPIDNSASVSLFPFLAVLLCTMGALLVVLVAVSRSARNKAMHQAAKCQQIAAVGAEDPQARAELDKIDQYSAQLSKLRSHAEQQLRQDQLRLGQLENHMRRLQDDLHRLTAALHELDAMDEDHTDDRKQAQREIERMQRLIAERQTDIAALNEGAQSRKRAYALVPYEGPNSTFRRPICIECCNEGLILQPEGVCITKDDLQPPLGSGNPLASALRAARDHYVQLHSEEGQGRETEPYPMLFVRPGGEELFVLARRAIEAGDFDFGFEPVETHWELKFGAVDPQLASIEEQAIEHARMRQRLLAAAAPRAYRHPALGSAGRFEFDDEPSEFSGGRGRDAGGQNRSAAVMRTTRSNGSAKALEVGTQAAANNSTSGNGPSSSENGDVDRYGDAADGQAGNDEIARTDREANEQEHAPRAADGPNSAKEGNSPAEAAPGEGAGSDANSKAAAAPGGMAGEQSSSAQQPFDPHSQANEKTWTPPRKHARAVPIRRTVQVVVRESQVGIPSGDMHSNRRSTEGKSIAFSGATVDSMDQFVKAVQDHVAEWGIAGDGLYWRPVLELQVGPDGQRRAEDLMRLLENSDIEVHLPGTAMNTQQGGSRATR